MIVIVQRFNKKSNKYVTTETFFAYAALLSFLSVASESAHEVTVVVRPYAERGHVVFVFENITDHFIDKKTQIAA